MSGQAGRVRRQGSAIVHAHEGVPARARAGGHEGARGGACGPMACDLVLGVDPGTDQGHRRRAGEAMIAVLLLAIDLHLQTPRTTATIEGTWTYAPLDGSAAYKIQIRATQGGFYEFEGRREGADKPVLQFCHAAECVGFWGESAHSS